jgi:hypothetical protein
MRGSRLRRDRRRGSALITFLGVIVVVSLAAAALVTYAKNQAYAVGRVRDHVKAQIIAEAGANDAYSVLKSNFALRSDPGAFPATAFGGGTYDVAVTPVGVDAALIECTATFGDATAVAMMDIKDFGAAVPPGGGGGGAPPPVGAYECAILAGSIDYGGNGQTDCGAGRVHSNSTYDQNGTTDLKGGLLSACTYIKSVGNGKINSNAEAPSFQKKSPGNITGTATAKAVAAVPFPELDLGPYYQWALAHGEVYASDPGTYTPAGGVMWVNGSIHASGGATIQGCIIATGDIKLTGNCTHTQVGGLPALISRDGSIDVNSCIETHGLIYAMNGDVKFAGNGKQFGSVFAKGRFWKTGGWDAVAYVDSTPPLDPADDPAMGGGGSSSSIIGVTAWQK